MEREGRIPNGATVEWVSQANARALRKRGKVLAFVPRFRSRGENMRLPYGHAPGSPTTPHDVCALVSPEAKWADIRTGNDRSANDRYLVEVPREGKRPLYYAPLASVVERQNPEKVES